MTNGLLGQLSACNLSFISNPVSTQQFGEVIDLVQNGSVTGTGSAFLCTHDFHLKIQGTSAKRLLRHLIKTRTKDSPLTLLKDYQTFGSAFESPRLPSADLRSLCELVIQDFPDEVATLKASAGGDPVINKLIGSVMKKSNGRVDAKAVREMLLLLARTGVPSD